MDHDQIKEGIQRGDIVVIYKGKKAILILIRQDILIIWVQEKQNESQKKRMNINEI